MISPTRLASFNSGPAGFPRNASGGPPLAGLLIALMLAAVSLSACSCSKKPEAPGTQALVPAEGSPGAQPAPSPPAAQPLPASSPAIAANASAEAVAAQLTLELRRYIAYTRTIPKSFEEFTAHDPIKFPPPPAGKKYVIAGGKVVLQ